MLEPLFKKVAALNACIFIKKRLRHRCFPLKFATFFRASFFTEHPRWLLLGVVNFEQVFPERGLLNINKCCCLRYFFRILLVNLLIYKKMITSSFIEGPTWWNKALLELLQLDLPEIWFNENEGRIYISSAFEKVWKREWLHSHSVGRCI